MSRPAVKHSLCGLETAPPPKTKVHSVPSSIVLLCASLIQSIDSARIGFPGADLSVAEAADKYVIAEWAAVVGAYITAP